MNFVKAHLTKELQNFTTKQTFSVVITMLQLQRCEFFYDGVNELYIVAITTIFMEFVQGLPLSLQHLGSLGLQSHNHPSRERTTSKAQV